jgi:signal transduction histidine kinase
MKRLTDDLLLLARADSGQLNLKYESVDLRQIARDVVDTFQPMAAEKPVRLHGEWEAACVGGDASRLGQVVSNLVANAVQFSLPHGEIFVRTKVDAGEALLIVQDQGVGIESKAQPQIFDRFFRGDRARSCAADSGAGLGLSLVKEIVTAHGGTVQVSSEPGLGTTMTVRIPLAAKQS